MLYCLVLSNVAMNGVPVSLSVQMRKLKAAGTSAIDNTSASA
jgi:hypothetical protein